MPAATTSAASDIPFSSEKNPIAWDTTSRRRIISRNATSTTAKAIASAVIGSTGLRIGRRPMVKNPNAATTIAISTALATLSAPLPAISSWVSRSSLRTTTGTATTLIAAEQNASA